MANPDTAADKRKINVLESLDQMKFDDATEQSYQLIMKRGNQDTTFRIGIKVLSTIGNLNKPEHLTSAFQLFDVWFEFCLSFDQVYIAKNNIIYYCVVYIKNLLNEKEYEITFKILDKVQTIYTFINDDEGLETDKYLKYLAPLTYNSSQKKELITETPDISIKLFVHGILFYLKLKSNFYTILDLVRAFEVSLNKLNKVNDLYNYLFDFLNKSLKITNNDIDTVTGTKKQNKNESIVLLNERTQSTSVKDKIYIIRVYMALYVNYILVCYNMNLNKFNLISELSKLESFLNDVDFLNTNEMDDGCVVVVSDDETDVDTTDLNIRNYLFDLLKLIINYSNQFVNETSIQKQLKQKETTKTSKSTKANSLSQKTQTVGIEQSSKENCLNEKKILKKINEFYLNIVDNQSLFKLSILNYLFEILISVNLNILNDPVSNSKYLKHSLVELYIGVSTLYSNTIRMLFPIHYNREKFPRNFTVKPLSLYIICGKLIEQSLKSDDSKLNEWVNSETGVELSIQIIKDHNSYLKWIKQNNLLTNEDISKHYLSLESLSIRLCTQFYTENRMDNYIQFQIVSLKISIDRLKFLFNSDKNNLNDLSLLKNFRSICDNMLLSFRLSEKFDDAIDKISEAYEFLKSFSLEQNEIEWLVTNWCKIKRDLSKINSLKLQKITIADYFNLRADLVEEFLLEEIRVYNYFKTLDYSVMMNDEIYFALEKLENTNTNNFLIKSRIYIEIAQFTWCNHKETINKFNLPGEDYLVKAQTYLDKYICSLLALSKNVNMLNLLEIDDNKENSKNSKQLPPTPQLIILSPASDDTMPSTRKKRKQIPIAATNKKSNNKNPTNKSPLIQTNNICKSLSRSPTSSSSSTLSSTTASTLSNNNHLTPTKNNSSQKQETCHCVQCIQSKIIEFQLNLFKMLCDYSNCRNKMSQSVTNLYQSRIKLKDAANITTNADNLNLQTISSSCLICPEFCDETNLKMNDEPLIQQLNKCLTCLKNLLKLNKNDLKKSFLCQPKTLKKQYLDSIDLLAQLYGFFGHLTNRIKVLEIKLEFIYLEFDVNNSNGSSCFDGIYVNSILSLMKSYLNANMCDEFFDLSLKIFLELKEKVSNNVPPTQLAAANHLAKKVSNEKDLIYFNKVISLDDIENLILNDKFLSAKPEFLTIYYLLMTHYFILKHKGDEALKLLQSKINNLAIFNGKQTVIYYEIKYYLKYLQFMLSMSIVGKNENLMQDFFDNETPLSLLEDCYTSAFSVARYYLHNSVEPSRILAMFMLNLNENEKNEDENIYFNIGNAESYRILTECLDMMQAICKYYIEISRYRDAIGYIREGLDIAQLHFSKRRISLFLLHQINADLIASCVTEANSRLNIVENLIGSKQIDLNDLNETILNDLCNFRNFIYLTNMKMLRETKLKDQSTIDCKDLIKKTNLLYSIMNNHKKIKYYCIDHLVDFYLIISNYLKNFKEFRKNKEIILILKKLCEILKSNSSTQTSLYERWNLAEYYCLAFELDSNLNSLKTSHLLLKTNPHPAIYRRICLHLFENEKDPKLKIEYLLETQSIALRHKACSIQMRHKRKSNISMELFEKIFNSLSFNHLNDKMGLMSKINKYIPVNCIAVSLILIDSNNLCVVRLESEQDPILYRLKYSQKYNDEFKQIINENDRSMKQSERTKFWASRSLLNKRLLAFTEDLEKCVLTYGKGLFLGSYKNFDMNKFLEIFKKETGFDSLNTNQIDLIKIILYGLEYLDSKELADALKTEFDEAKLTTILNYLLDYKSNVVGLSRKHVCLLVDKNLHQIPWESLPSLKKQTITRMPSIHFLISHAQTSSFYINKDNAFYIVDPGGDLVYTKQKFQTFFETKKCWEGLIGVAPNENQFKKALTEYELFIYTGHGSGSQYYPSDDVQKLRVQACSILMGCSSGNQYVLGDFEPYGTVLAYILAGCPCIIGNLWDVTDRDIDRLTEDFLDSWLNEDSKENKLDDINSVCIHLNKARYACKMVYLNGSAPIVYGLPVSFKSYEK